MSVFGKPSLTRGCILTPSSLTTTRLALLLIAVSSVAGAATTNATCGSITNQLTDLSAAVINCSQFNPALGTLTSITITVSGSLAGSITLTNKAAASETVTASTNSQFLLHNPLTGFSFPSTLFSAVLTTGSVPIASGATVPFNNLVSGTSTNGPLTNSVPATFTSYVGTGTFPVSFDTQSSLTVLGGGGNVSATEATTASAGVTVVYAFTPAPPQVTCPVLAASTSEANLPFNSPAIAVTGGTAPYTFSVATGTLPPGLSLNTSTGAITGTPTAPGSFSIQVTDANGLVGVLTCPFAITPDPVLTCPAATSTGEVLLPFNSPAIAVAGGTAPFTFSVATGTLPTGLTLNTSTGAITGTPTVAGSFTIQVKDANGVVGTPTCPFTITSGPVLTCLAVQSTGAVGVPFNSPAPGVTGGTAPFTFSVATGTLPTGLTLNTSTGAITGTPTAPGSFSIQVKDANGVVGTPTCPVTIALQPVLLTCSTTSTGMVGVPFNSPALMVTGGTPPYTFSVATGTLPPGLTLNTSTGAITGTPTAPGTFTIQVTDANGVVSTGTCAYSIGTPSSTCPVPAFQVRYASNLNIGESYINIANPGTDGAPLLGPGFGPAAGNVCVNVYAFDPGEELVSCCSCLVTPDETVNLGVNRDLTVKTLTGVIPTSVTVKLVATLAGAGGAGTSCSGSAAQIVTATPACGLTAWGTTLHAIPSGFGTTETRFTPATLSSAEMASIGGRCASIMGNGSTFGLCNSCRAGALGAGASQQ
jgi:hypothetical protein